MTGKTNIPVYGALNRTINYNTRTPADKSHAPRPALAANHKIAPDL